MDCDIELTIQTTPGGGVIEAPKLAREISEECGAPVASNRAPSVAPSDGKKRSKFRLGAIVVALFLSLFVAALDATIIATAAPTISRSLDSAAGYSWIGAAYLLAHAAAGPIWAKLSDIWGRRLIVLSALALFFASSAVCATAKSMEALIIGRAFQGGAGGGLILLVQVCISDLFSMRERSLLLGLTEGIWALAGGIGPVLGGVFASLVTWRWCFYINLPVSGCTFILIALFLDIKHTSTSFADGVKAIDWFGLLTFLGFTVMVLLGLDFGGAIFPWGSAKVVALLVVGGCMVFAFVWSEAKVAKYPLIPLELFRKKSNIASLLVVFFHGFAFISAEYYMPLFIQSVLEASPLISGLLLLPLIVTTAFFGILGGFIIHRTGHFRELMWAGTIILCIGFGLFVSFNESTTKAKAVGFGMVVGAGSGLLFEPPLIALQSQSLQSDVATVTSTMSFVRSMALTISVVVGGAIFQNSMDERSSSLKAAGLSPTLLDALSGKHAAANVDVGKTLENTAWDLAVKTAFAYATRNMWICYTVFAFLGVLAGFFIEQSHLTTDHVETVTGIRKRKDSREQNEGDCRNKG